MVTREYEVRGLDYESEKVLCPAAHARESINTIRGAHANMWGDHIALTP